MTKEELLLFQDIQKNISNFNSDLKEVARDTNETKTSIKVIETKIENLVTIPYMQNIIQKHEDTKHRNSIIPHTNGSLKKSIGIGASISAGAGGVFYLIYELVNSIIKMI